MRDEERESAGLGERKTQKHEEWRARWLNWIIIGAEAVIKRVFAKNDKNEKDKDEEKERETGGKARLRDGYK